MTNWYVNSFGGSGSTLLARWLGRWNHTHHLHDPKPPEILFTGSTYAHPDDAHDVRMDITSETAGVSTAKVFYIYRDPVESFLARPSWGHCANIGGDWERLKEWADSLPPDISPSSNREVYIQMLAEHVSQTGIDYMGYEKHFDNWTRALTQYEVLFIDYKHLWDQRMQSLISEYLCIPHAMAKFPAKKETKKNVDLNTVASLRKLYEPLNNKMSEFTSQYINELFSRKF